MSRPTVQHKGFLIPNAGDVASPQMAEPDRIDFNTLGNARYGVIDGCEITVSTTTAMNTAGNAIINGVLVPMAGGQSASLGSSGTQDRYDLLTVVSSGYNGVLTVVPGKPAADPVFPDPPTNSTTLAAVFCPAGASTYVDNVIDKRKMLSDSLQTKIDPAASLVVNRNGTGNLFSINGSGTTVWGTDTVLQRTSAKTLQISDNLGLAGDLAVGDAITAGSLYAEGRVTGHNLRHGTVLPPTGNSLGDIFQHDTGRLYLFQASGWMEMATVASAIPVGTVITSLVAPTAIGAGWVPLDGKTVIQEDVVGSLFAIPALNGYINPGGTTGHRQMTMPDATSRVLLGDFVTAGTRGGSSTIAVALANLPNHKHDTRVVDGGGWTIKGSTGQAGRHGHRTKDGTGVHGHQVIDPGHQHNGAANPVNGMPGAFVALMWGGQNKIDAYFNDRSHTYSVEAMDWTYPAFSGISIGTGGSQHVHDTEEALDHNHTVTIDNIPVHGHGTTETAVGGSQPISYTPQFLSVYVYIRS